MNGPTVTDVSDAIIQIAQSGWFWFVLFVLAVATAIVSDLGIGDVKKPGRRE